MKYCNKCQSSKTVNSFFKHSKSPDGLNSVCKECHKKYRQNQTKEQQQKIEEQKKVYRKRNATKIAEYNKKYYDENFERLSLLWSEAHYKNRDAILKRHQEYYHANKSKFREYDSYRRSRILNATPSWLSEQERIDIQDFYSISRMFKLYTGHDYHVDHIVPLKHDLVCGLHVPWNLQVLPAEQNLSKSNKFNTD